MSNEVIMAFILKALTNCICFKGLEAAYLSNQEDLRGTENATKELQYALGHQTGMLVDLVFNLTKCQ